ncbi:MAG: pilus assembly protein PilM [Candidatus Omnitrophota bacterium]|nr:pilus assembly protein PilM [Candidatus Omnitrophota bacterium]MBU1929581.1 pilus assembly protein PilM [Candidatus Omnitrophota bacterium]MBU2034987.1 pilus assembly protein PilM [Candidatus Omnitrophota bacterium]MBU2258588.1 pilus assembly protein PilM [Candidatus Omnitrophota bacterium]
MNSHSIYFGPKSVTIVELKGRKVVNSVDIALDKILYSGIEDKVPMEVKIVAIINNELRKNRFEIKEASVVIPGNDLITRTFDLPSSLSQRELSGAINFEARKYIPFKIEELVTGFQWRLDLKSKKILIIFLGIKTEIFDRYLYIFKQLNIKINVIEYSAFSILRLLKLSGSRIRGITAVADIDLSEADEGNFIVLDNGYPLFSRDINLSAGMAQESVSSEAEKGLNDAADKFKAEMRISLDFYQRKFPSKPIEKVYFISPADCRSQLEAFIKEKGLVAEFVDCSKYAGNFRATLGYFKAFGGALYKQVRYDSIKIDLLSAREKTLMNKEKKGISQGLVLAELLSNFRVDLKAVILGVLICVSAYGFRVYQELPLKKDINDIVNMRPKFSTTDANLSYDELVSLSSKYQNKTKELNSLIRRESYITEQIDALPRIVPNGMWLRTFSFTQDKLNNREIIIKGSVYLEDGDKELQLVNKFFGFLKQNSKFERFSKNMHIISVGRVPWDKISITSFEIACRDYK